MLSLYTCMHIYISDDDDDDDDDDIYIVVIYYSYIYDICMGY